MIIVLDTNVYQKDYRLRSAAFSVLIRYLKSTNSRIILPRVVREELLANYCRKIEDLVSKSKNCLAALDAALIEDSGTRIPDLDFNGEARRYFSFVRNKLSIRDVDVIDYRSEHLAEVVSRAVYRRRPCNEKGEEIRDALLWCSILDVAKNSPKESITFISENVRQFGAPTGALHPDLLAEVSREALALEYFRSLDEFAKVYSEHIDYITAQWLSESINLTELFKKLTYEIENKAGRKVIGQGKDGLRFNGEATLFGGGLTIDSHFVYKSSSESISVEVLVRGEVEVEFGVLKHPRLQDEPFYHRRHRNNEPGVEYLYPEVEVSLDVEIKDKHVVKLEVVSCDVYVSLT